MKTAIAVGSVVILAACAPGRAGSDETGNPVLGMPASNRVDDRCSFGSAPTVVRRDGNTVLQFWTLTESETISAPVLPEDTALAEYRSAIQRAGADLIRPIADKPRPTNEAERDIWTREEQNVEFAFSGRGGRIRPIQCLDALLFAYQNARYSQITHPTEFIAGILRKRVEGQTVLKVYFAAGDTMFPPKDFYGFDEMERDVAAGWEFWTVLHNHTVQSNNGESALGVPAPSTSDVDLFRSLAEAMGLQSAWITNGFFTIEIPASALEHYQGRS